MCTGSLFRTRRALFHKNRNVGNTPNALLNWETELQDNVCRPITECKPGEEYEVSAFVPDANTAGVDKDRVCARYTQCDPNTQYLLRRGDGFNDNICAAKTLCVFAPFPQFEAIPAVDSPDFSTNGTDAVCSNYTRCAPGFYTNFSGDDTNDAQCAPCPPGTSGAGDGAACVQCAFGHFNPYYGQAECQRCKLCDSNHINNNSAIAGYDVCPTGQTCVMGYHRRCNSTADGECALCPTETWDLNPRTGLCTPCAEGHTYVPESDRGGLTELERCIPCRENFYCPSPTTHRMCQGIRIFQRASDPPDSYHIVPSSPPGSTFASECNCSGVGGFTGTGDGLVGCKACPDGTYAPVNGDGTCRSCPIGKYAARSVHTDLFKCPTGGSPRIVWNLSDPWPILPSTTDCDVVVGAVDCQPCPTGFPQTRQVGAASVSECTQCRKGEYWDSGGGGGCRTCIPECTGPELYEVVPCTDTGNRVCAFCRWDECGPHEYAVPCPGAWDSFLIYQSETDIYW